MPAGHDANNPPFLHVHHGHGGGGNLNGLQTGAEKGKLL